MTDSSGCPSVLFAALVGLLIKDSVSAPECRLLFFIMYGFTVFAYSSCLSIELWSQSSLGGSSIHCCNGHDGFACM